jgi:hypothetical protein
MQVHLAMLITDDYYASLWVAILPTADVRLHSTTSSGIPSKIRLVHSILSIQYRDSLLPISTVISSTLKRQNDTGVVCASYSILSVYITSHRDLNQSILTS